MHNVGETRPLRCFRMPVERKRKKLLLSGVPITMCHPLPNSNTPHEADYYYIRLTNTGLPIRTQLGGIQGVESYEYPRLPPIWSTVQTHIQIVMTLSLA